MSDEMKHGVFQTPEAAKRLRIYIGEADKVNGIPAYEAIVTKARELHVAGATVFRSPMGFGANSRIHTAKILRLSEDLPIVIEIVDVAGKIDPLISCLDEMLKGGLVTIEDVGVLLYRPKQSGV